MKTIYSKIVMILTATLIMSCGAEKKKEAASSIAETNTSSTLLIEKPQLTFGFIKLTDMAPLAIAKEKGFFEDEGLFVSVEAQSNWKNVLDRVRFW